MLSKSTRRKIVGLFQKIGQAEQQIEVLREVLCGQDLFEPYMLFKTLDNEKKGYLDAQNIHSFLQHHNMPHDVNTIMPLIQFFSLLGDNCLRYTDFMQMVLTTNNINLRAIVTQRPTYEVHDSPLPFEVEYGLARIIQKEISLFSKLNKDKFNLIKQDDFSIKLAFESIAHNSGIIQHEQLTNFLIKYRYQSYKSNDIHDQYMIYCIFKRLDQNRDNKIDLEDFMQLIEPSEGIKESLITQIEPSTPLRQYCDPADNESQFMSKTATHLKNNNSSSQKTLKLIQDQISYPNRRSMISIQKHVLKMREVNVKKLTPQKESQYSLYIKGPQNTIQEELLYLVESLKIFIQLESECELWREQLCLQRDVDLFSILECFDIDKAYKLCPSDVTNTLQQLNIHPTQAQIFLWVKRFDKDKDGKLSLQEFSSCLLPQNGDIGSIAQSSTKKGIKKRTIKFLKEILSPESLEILALLFKCQIENEVAIECIRQKLNKRSKFNVKQLFQLIDLNQDGMINLDDLAILLGENGILIEQKQLNLLLLRFDKNDDNFVSYAEFISEIHPKSKQQF